MNKLGTLLNRAQAYSQFLADRLREQIQPLPGPEEQHDNNEKGSAAGFQQPSLVTGGRLRRYQLEGVQWLVSLFENGLNGILADEMGLGKTIQCIAFLAFLREQGISGPFLIVAPLSTLSNWVSEFARFAPTIPAILYHGGVHERADLRKTHRLGGGGGGPVEGDKEGGVSVVVTSYELAMKDARHLAPIAWKYLIIDEGHRLKNLNCRLIRELKDYRSDNRLLITGTPLQNNLTELWSLLNFLLPQIFANVDDFLGWFDFDLDESTRDTFEAEQADMVAKLHVILRPLLLRRLKTDVERELPKKREYILSAALSPLQREYYQAVWAGRIRDLIADASSPPEGEGGGRRCRGKRPKSYRVPDESDPLSTSDSDDFGAISNVPATSIAPPKSYSAAQGLQNRVMQLRKVCNHPYLFKYPVCRTNPERLLVDEGLVQCSGKMRLLDQLLRELCRRRHKVLIFSQMSRMLDILQDYLGLRKYNCCRIDGSVPHAQRQAELRRFNEERRCKVFLLSTRAGGLGLNLVAADTVIFFDSDWVSGARGVADLILAG